MRSRGQQRPAGLHHGMRGNLVHGHRCADAQVAVAHHQQVADAWNVLDVDDQVGMDKAPLDADQQIGHACEGAGAAVVF